MFNLKNPTLSVIMVVYNGGVFLKEAIESVLVQTFGNFEFLIINDGSTDETIEIIDSFNDERIIVFNRKHYGLTSSLNFGLQKAKAPIIARMDADDICLPDRLKIQVIELEKRSDIAALGGSAAIIDELGRETGQLCIPPETDEDILKGILELRGNSLIHPTVVLRRDKLLAIGGYNERFLASQDVDLWLRLGAVGKLGAVSAVVLKFRHHPEAVSFTRRNDQLTFGMAARICYFLREKGLDDPSTASDETWNEFISHIRNELTRRGVYEVDAYRIELRRSFRENSALGELWRVAWLFLQNPKRLNAIWNRQQYLHTLRYLSTYYACKYSNGRNSKRW
jgi:glycosyltransferase involved in cell wall biosynthesis